MANKRVPTPAKKSATKRNTPPPPPPGPVDDMEGFDEENGGVITQAATHERDGLLDEELHDDLEFEEPGAVIDEPAVNIQPNISTMPRPSQPPPQPARHVVSATEMQKAMQGGKNPNNPVKSAHPFSGGSILNGKKWPDVDPKFCKVIFGRVRSYMTDNGVMNVRNQSKADVRTAFIHVMHSPFENKDFFPDLVAQFCMVHNILKD